MAVKLARWSEGEKNPLQPTSQCDERWEETVSRTYPRWRHCLLKDHSLVERRTYQIHAHMHTRPHTHTRMHGAQTRAIDRASVYSGDQMSLQRIVPGLSHVIWIFSPPHDCISCSLLAFLPLLTFRYLSLSPAISFSHRLYPRDNWLYMLDRSTKWWISAIEIYLMVRIGNRIFLNERKSQG